MSSGDQRLKTKQQEPQDLQNRILQFTKDIKVHETKDYVGLCVFCTMGVDRNEMAYKNNLLFHSICFEQQGKNFPAVNQELASKQASAKIELVQLKNLKNRNVVTNSPPKSKPRPKRKTKKPRPKRQTAKKRRTTTKKRKPKRRVTRRPSRRRTRRRSSKRRPRRR